jgi:DNA primase
MSEFEPRQIFIVHQSVWDAMERWAADRRFYLQRIPDGADEDGRVFFRDDEETTPTYAFMPKEIF